MTVGELIEALGEYETYKEVNVDGYDIVGINEIDDAESPRDGNVDIESNAPVRKKG
jgi:hypothetical protein